MTLENEYFEAIEKAGFLKYDSFSTFVRKLIDAVACVVVGIPKEFIYNRATSSIDDEGFYRQGIPYPFNEYLHKKCTNMNDIERKTFPEIADWLESNVEFI